jgi:hypothetical protein
MAAAQDSGRGLIKGYIYVMLMLAIGAGGTAMYLHSGGENSVEASRLKLKEAVTATEDVRGNLAPSLREYFELQSQGRIASSERKELNDVERLVNDVIVESGIPIGSFRLTGTLPRPAARGQQNENQRWAVRVELGLGGGGAGSGAVGVTRPQWQKALQGCREKLGSFAVCETLKINSVSTGTRLNQQLAAAVNEQTFLYRVEFEYVWYTPAPAAAAAVSTGGTRPR